MRASRYGAVLALAAALSGCAGVTAADRAPRTDPVGRLAAPGPSPWIVDLGDPVLADLLRRADGGALDVKAALARLEHAQADVEAAKAARRLHLNFGSVVVSGGRSVGDTQGGAAAASEANYEIDLWGRRNAELTAATFDLTAAAADLTTARLLVAAEIVRTYAALRSAQAAVAGGEVEQRDAAQMLALIALRQAQGAATGETWEVARQAQAATADRIATAREDAGLLAALLADLAGDPHLVIAAGVAPMSTPVVDGVSSDVVDARPDVQAALARLRAADAERAAAIAASRPQFRISALFGAPGASLGALLDGRSLAWALASSVSHQVLDGAANRARVHAAGADADAADIAYRKTVLSAWSEVRAALVDQARAGREQAMAAQALAQAATASDLGRLRHAEGTADGLALTALRNDQALAQARSRAANLRTVDARVRLALATGGR